MIANREGRHHLEDIRLVRRWEREADINTSASNVLVVVDEQDIGAAASLVVAAIERNSHMRATIVCSVGEDAIWRAALSSLTSTRVSVALALGEVGNLVSVGGAPAEELLTGCAQPWSKPSGSGPIGPTRDPLTTTKCES